MGGKGWWQDLKWGKTPRGKDLQRMAGRLGRANQLSSCKLQLSAAAGFPLSWDAMDQALERCLDSRLNHSRYPSSPSEAAELLCKYMQIHANNKAINMSPKPQRERFALIKAHNGIYPRGRKTISCLAQTREGLDSGTERQALVAAVQLNTRMYGFPLLLPVS